MNHQDLESSLVRMFNRIAEEAERDTCTPCDLAILAEKMLSIYSALRN